MDRVYNQEKIEAIDDIKKRSQKSNIMILTDHQSLTAAQMTTLRNKLFDVNAQYRVIKNTLAVRAIESGDADKVREVFNGSSSIIFGYGDVIAPAKILVSFIKDNNEKPAIKGAIMDGKYVDVSVVKQFAALPSKEVLIAKVLGGMKSPIVSFAAVLQGPILKLVYALNEISKKKEVQ